MNLKIKKADLKGTVYVGYDWLVCGGWATKIGDDRRFLSVETVNAAFAGLDVQELPSRLATMLESYVSHAPEPFTADKDTFYRTSVLVEDEDGALTRVYRDPTGQNECFNDTFMTILGEPELLALCGSDTYVCQAGVIARTTAVAPEWVEDLL
jgi:hypothetical protein